MVALNQKPLVQNSMPYRIDPMIMEHCMNKISRVRLLNGDTFRYFATVLSGNSVAGYKEDPFTKFWNFYAMDLNEIASVSC